jgi:laminin alpha 3/5
LKDPGHKAAWIDYVLLVPMDSFSDAALAEQPVDLAGDFIATCGQNHFHADAYSPGQCYLNVTSIHNKKYRIQLLALFVSFG